MRTTTAVLVLLLCVANITAKRNQKNNACYKMCDLSCDSNPSKSDCSACRKKCETNGETGMESGLPSCEMMCSLFVCRDDNTDKCTECNKNCGDSSQSTTPATNMTTQAPTKQTKSKRGRSGLKNKKMKDLAILTKILDFLNKMLPIFGSKQMGGKNMMGTSKRNSGRPRRPAGPNKKPGNKPKKWQIRNNKPGGGYGRPGGNRRPGGPGGKPKGGPGKWNKSGPKSKRGPGGKPKGGPGKWNKWGQKPKGKPNKPKMGNRSNSSPKRDPWAKQGSCAKRCEERGYCPGKMFFKQRQKKYSKQCNLLLQNKCASSGTMAQCFLKEILNSNGTCPVGIKKKKSTACITCVESCQEKVRERMCLRRCKTPDKCMKRKEKTEMMGSKTKNCIECLRKNCRKTKMSHACIISASMSQCADHCPKPTDQDKMRSNMCMTCKMDCGKSGPKYNLFEIPPPVPPPKPPIMFVP